MSESTIWETFETVDIREIGNENIEEIVKFTIDCQLNETLLHPDHKDDMHNVFTEFYQYLLTQKNSLIAVNRETNELVGVIICLIMTDYMRTWLAIMLKIKEPRLKIIFNLYLLMAKEAHKLHSPNTPMDSLQVFRIAVPKLYKGSNWKTRLLNAAIKMTKCFRVPCVTHLAFTMNDQIRAMRAGMQEEYRIYYNQYIDDETKTRPFVLTKFDELCVIFYKRYVQEHVRYDKIKGKCKFDKRVKSSRRYYEYKEHKLFN